MRQTLSPLGATTFHYITTGFGSGALAETMFALASPFLGLVCSFGHKIYESKSLAFYQIYVILVNSFMSNLPFPQLINMLITCGLIFGLGEVCYITLCIKWLIFSSDYDQSTNLGSSFG